MKTDGHDFGTSLQLSATWVWKKIERQFKL